MKNNTLILVLVGVFMAVAGFTGGLYYQKAHTRALPGTQITFGRNGNRQFTGGSGMPRLAGGAVTGTITAFDDKSITVKMNDGSTRIVLLTDSTTYRTSSDAKRSDLSVGKTVAVFGAGNADNSTTATSIELNPVMRQRNDGSTPTQTQ